MSTEWGDEPVAPSPAPSEWGDTPVAVESPYSPAAIAQQRQDVVRTTAELRRLREEAAAESARPKLNIGVRNPLTGEIAYQTEIPGPLVALGSEAIKSSPSVAAGAAAGSAVMPLANTVGAIPGPVGVAGRFGIPLVAGGLAAIGTRMAQEAALPQILPEGAQDIYDVSGRIAAENPNAAMVGQFLGSAPFFRPGLPIGTTGAARLTVPLVAGGIGAGIEGAQQLAAGEFDPQKLAIAAAGQALFNRETALGAKIAPNFMLPNIASETSPIREVAARMEGKPPQQQLQVLNQEVALRKDTLTPDQERIALETKQALEKQVDAQKALEDAQALQEKQAKAVQDIQKAQAQDAANAQKALAEANKPPEIPKSEQILAEPVTKPKPLANVATEIGTQTSPFALQGKLNELTAVPAQPEIAPTAPKLAEPVPDVAADRAAYDRIQKQLSDIGHKNMDTPEYQALWQASEDIKNRHGGMPPGEVAAETARPESVSKQAKPEDAPLPWETPEEARQRVDDQRKYDIAEATRKAREAMGLPPPKPLENLPQLIKRLGRERVSALIGDWNIDADLHPDSNKIMAVADARNRTGNLPISTKDFMSWMAEHPDGQPKQGEPKNAIQEPSTGSLLQRPPEGTGEAGGQRGRVEQGVQGNEVTQARPAGNQVRPEPLQESLKPPAQMKRPELRAELAAQGVKDLNGIPLEDANAAQLMNAVGKLRRGQLLDTPADIIDVLQSKKRLPKRPRGEVASAGPDLLYDTAHDAALDVAILGIQAGRSIAEIVRMAIAKFKAMHPGATDEQIATLEQDIRDAHTPPSKSPTEPQQLMAEAPSVEPVAGRSAEATQAASIRRRQRGAISTRAALALGGAPAGAAVGFASTDQQAGESDEAYRARLLKNTLLGAAGGAAAGFGIGAMAQGAQGFTARSPKKAPLSKAVELPTPGEGQGIRQTAEKVIENRQYPEQLRKTLTNDPDIIYDKFKLGELADRVGGATEDELKAMRASPDLSERLGATAELANRYSLSPDKALQDEGARLYSELAQNLTNPAQILGLGKLVKTPQGFVTALNESLKDVDRTLSGPQEAELRRLATESIKTEQRLAATSRAAQSDFSAANEAAYRQAKAENAKAQKAMDDYVHRVAPEAWDTILSKVIQGNLLTPLSLIQNPIGNLVFQPVLRTSRAIGSALDEIFAAASGKPRTLSELSPIPAKAEAQAFGEGIKIAGRELLTGPGEDSYIKGEVQRGFKPLRSLSQAFTGNDIAVRPDGTIATSDRLKKLFEGTFGAPAEAMFRFLSLGDKPFRRSEEMRVLMAQARLKGLKGRDLIQFLEFPDKHTQTLLETEGRHAIFAQENAGVRKLNQFLDSGVAELLGVDKIPAVKGALKVFFRTQVPFRQFPVNFITTAINFAVPEVAFARAAYHGGLSRAFGKQPDRRAAFIALGEGVLGTMMYGAANYLWKNGLISEPADKDAKQRSAQYEQFGPARINVSGLERAMQGGDPKWQSGDTTVDWSRLGIPAFVFNVYTGNAAKGRQETARTGENRKRTFEPGKFATDRLASFPGVTSFALDQSFLSGTSALLDALRDWDEFGDKWTQNTFRAISSIPVPNTVEALARTQSKYIPELRGDNLGETLNNVWKFKTLQLPQDERSNLKRDLWGQPIPRTPEGKNLYLDQFIDVSKSAAKVNEPFKQALIDLYRTTESPDVYPPLPGRNLGVEGIMVKLTPDDYDRYQQFVGKARRQYAEQVVANPRFQATDTLPEAKILALQEAYNEGAKTGKEQLLAQPGVVERYFPDLVGKPPAPPETSRVISRDVKARGRLRVQQASEWGDEPVGR